MASSVKLLIMLLDQVVDVVTDFVVNYVDTIGGIVLTLIVVYGIKGFLAMLGD